MAFGGVAGTTALSMVLRSGSPPSSPAPPAHRGAASGLDRDAPAERVAEMPLTAHSVVRLRRARDLPGPGIARRGAEIGHCFDLHVAVLELPFIVLFQQNRTD